MIIKGNCASVFCQTLYIHNGTEFVLSPTENALVSQVSNDEKYTCDYSMQLHLNILKHYCRQICGMFWNIVQGTQKMR